MNKRILVIDNYDSFTYNLVHYLEDLGVSVSVYRNDQISPEDCGEYNAVVLSPGPGIPSEAGNLLAIIKHLKGKIPMLGICLGHQAIVEVYGGKILNLNKVFHGLATPMKHSGSALFENVPLEFYAGRYHSWVADRNVFPLELQTTAIDEYGEIMALENSAEKIYGVQFHPESIMTPDGKKMLENFVNLI
jgi:anthranilate synthase component 2